MKIASDFSFQDVTIKTDRLILRTLKESFDLAEYHGWFQKPMEFIVYSIRSDISVSNLKDYVKAKFHSADEILLGIYTKDEVHIGNIKLGPIKDKSAVLGVLIGNSNQRGKGVFLEVFKALKDFFYQNFEISRFELGVHRNNLPAIKAYFKAGFTESDKFHVIKEFTDDCLYLVYEID